MANPTTNYSWPMPTSTNLVTDLPADFALFGQPVDTTLKALNPQTTTGALAYRSAVSNVNTALPIGSTSQVLTVVSGVPAWASPAGGGKILQVVQGTTSTPVANSTTTFADTTLTATITPTLNTSKVLVLVSHPSNFKGTLTTNAFKFNLLRAGTIIYSPVTNGSFIGTNAMQNVQSVSFNYLDSPATTSSTIYKTQFANANASVDVNVQGYSLESTIILLEVGA